MAAASAAFTFPMEDMLDPRRIRKHCKRSACERDAKSVVRDSGRVAGAQFRGWNLARGRGQGLHGHLPVDKFLDAVPSQLAQDVGKQRAIAATDLTELDAHSQVVD